MEGFLFSSTEQEVQCSAKIFSFLCWQNIKSSSRRKVRGGNSLACISTATKHLTRGLPRQGTLVECLGLDQVGPVPNACIGYRIQDGSSCFLTLLVLLSSILLFLLKLLKLLKLLNLLKKSWGCRGKVRQPSAYKGYKNTNHNILYLYIIYPQC